jgi:4-amino-4-deoxy-L-arabinose transferase-like glycosyltransferase
VRQKILALILRPGFVSVFLTVAVALRLLWILFIHHDQVSDFAWYYQRGSDLAAGRGYSVDGMPTAYWPAGYPLFLGGLFYLFGPVQFIAKFANIIFYAATMWLTYLFTKKVFRSEVAARIAICLLALYPGQIAYTSLLTTEVLFQCLLVLGAVLFVNAEDRPIWWALSGLAWGLATFTKTQALFVPGIFLLVFLWPQSSTSRPASDQRGLLKFFKAGVLVYATLFLVLVPWLVRNYKTFGQPLLSTNGGIVLMIGNNPYATGNQIWDDNVRNLLGDLSNDYDANHIKGRELAREQRAKQIAVNFIVHHPGKFFALMPKKFLATYKSDVDGLYYSMGMVQNPGHLFNAGYLGLKIVAELYYLAIFALFLLELPAILRSNNPSHRISLYLTLYFTLVYLVYFGNARYHFAIMPFVIMYASLFLAHRLNPDPQPPAAATT